jgi:hypothetical protein
MRWNYAEALHEDDAATLDDLREAVTTLEDAGRTARRVFGSAHPTTTGIECWLRHARTALRARETPQMTLKEVEEALDALGTIDDDRLRSLIVGGDEGA